MMGWLIVATVVVAVVGLAAWCQRQLSRGGFATRLGRLVVIRRGDRPDWCALYMVRERAGEELPR
jgi:hypothetical protein